MVADVGSILVAGMDETCGKFSLSTQPGQCYRATEGANAADTTEPQGTGVMAEQLLRALLKDCQQLEWELHKEHEQCDNELHKECK